ncbi:hypothetical protein BHM03_00058171 [Ensete ventricosum]|nr:hypothetical protein BHM03_00058171 [Ensete ventricosum]
MVCTILASAWTWLVRPRKASVVTMSGAGFDAGEGNPGSVIILQKRLGVGTAAMASSVGRGWSGFVRCSVPESPNGRSGDMGPPSSAKNVRGESGACLVDTFRLCDYGASTAGSGPCRLYDHWRPPSLHSVGCPCRVDHFGGPAVRGYDVAAMSAFVISPVKNVISLLTSYCNFSLLLPPIDTEQLLLCYFYG